MLIKILTSTGIDVFFSKAPFGFGQGVVGSFGAIVDLGYCC